MSQVRKKRQWNFGIQFKLTLGLFVVFAMSAIGLNLIVSNQIRHNYEQQIQADTADMQNNANVYAQMCIRDKDGSESFGGGSRNAITGFRAFIGGQTDSKRRDLLGAVIGDKGSGVQIIRRW